MESNERYATMDGNEAAASIAYKCNEVIAIYPITPSSPMGELSDTWASQGQTNIWGEVPRIQEMQSEGGAAGAVHGALQGGALTTTFTASQGLLLMLPNMFKIAGELTSAVFHIAARSVATHALSIFGDHSDVMAARSTAWPMLFSGSIQEVHDMALIAQASTLKARLPFLHIFDGFRTSHEVMKIERISDQIIRKMIDDEDVATHRQRALSPDHPVVRGTAQNPDVFFQSREAVNRFYQATPAIVQEMMDRFAALTGRQYRLFDYIGPKDPERVVILMGSGAETAEETVEALNQQGLSVGLIKTRLFQPFSIKHFLDILPASVKKIAVLDRTKDPASLGEPLYESIVSALFEAYQSGQHASLPTIIGGRYGLGSKEFTPRMVKAVFEELDQPQPKRHFSVGIVDDVTNNSLLGDPDFSLSHEGATQAMFWGLGSDGTVGANKNSIKIIGEATDLYAQGYFVYDSKKSGARTISHLRFGPKPIKSTYLIELADFVGVHQFGHLDKYPILDSAKEGATLLLNSPFPAEETWEQLARPIQEQIIARNIRIFVVDGYKIAQSLGLGNRINTIMQACFFSLCNVIPLEEAVLRIKKAIQKTYGKRGAFVLRKNEQAVDKALESIYEVEIPKEITSQKTLPPTVSTRAPAFVQEVTAAMIAGKGDALPVSALPIDGTYPLSTAQWEKRNLALSIPVWEPDLCIQCGKCVMVCPHAVIRAKRYEPSALEGAPESFKSTSARWKEAKDQQYTIQVSADDCTGCTLCVEICPVKDKSKVSRKALNMEPQRDRREQESANWSFFEAIPDTPREQLHTNKLKDVQLLQPLFEFSGACAGCGETPYLRLMSQLFGDRSLVANATGCSSIYGGNLPTTPWRTNAAGRGPAWSNSLFEDNAEFGLGMRLAIDQQHTYALQLVQKKSDLLGSELTEGLLAPQNRDDQSLTNQRERVAQLKQKLQGQEDAASRDLLELADTLVPRDVWIVGGDGWAYDIGFGGLDHVLASGQNINVLVLDTEVYSNTGGQSSKATPRGAVAKFAAAGKRTPKKDLGMLAMSYKSIYVASVSMGADEAQTLKAFREAEAYDGPSLIIAYSPCIAHGIDMTRVLEQQQLAVSSGYWLLYRFDPTRIDAGQNPLQIDCKAPSTPLKQYLYNELRYRMLTQSQPEVAAMLLRELEEDIRHRWEQYDQLAHLPNQEPPTSQPA
ncbi:MAG: pyruvate:ferredoxin (flavodoxin) oxidoreductase [Myxococcales bacterium]|nr:pyruvate:ferredoxin (flavodoxin) oxidoreductase [Myxococcales bacterium]